MEAFVTLALIALALAAAAPALYALRRRLARPGELEIWRMLEKRGGDAAQEQGRSHAFAMAVRRCALCTSAERCREWLEGRSADRAEDFCPNARYLERVVRQ